ncbi:C40 family peptidase [Streptomyces sp. MUM 203J]|uniref:C40 family peptidase n=1 Tax=Streptomyces sp. MUM 203J TaxID=2791990 RepID=UPI001F03E9CF|nr:C40 family peptidase [Streptomyces sp. MUM 203J]
MASHRRTSPPGPAQSAKAAKATVLSAAAATAAAALAAPVHAEPAGTPTAEATRARVDRLYTEAEQATESYNKAGERTAELRGQVARAQDSVARGQERINHMRGALGSVAGAQYRSGGIDPTLALLLSKDPDTFLDRAATLDRISERQSGALVELRRAQQRLDQERAEATRALGELERSRATVARHKRTVEKKLAEARALLNSLTREERAAVDRASRSGAREQGPVPAVSGAAASSRAAMAVQAARSAVGKPYVWGANGPNGFDCSGLMQWSYAQAGVGLPRTSQAQRNAGRHVPLSEARPGDLVTYRSDASHVAMYMGNGQVVHAPYPGAPVRYDPVGMMPVSAVTRV